MFRKTLKIITFIIMSFVLLLFTIPFVMPVNNRLINENNKPFPESHFITINKVSLHYRSFIYNDTNNSKGNIMLIHGFSGSTFSWRKNIDTLSKAGYNVIAVDLPAFGYSSKDRGINHSASAVAELLWQLADTLNKGKWILVGHSMGAAIAGAMAAIKPDRTEKLIMVDGTFSGTKKNEGGGFLSWLIATPPVERLAEVVAKNYFFTFKEFHNLLSSAYSKEADSTAILGYLEPFKTKRSASAIMELGKSKETKTLSLKNINCPILLIWGTKDNWIPVNNAFQFINEKPNTKLQLIDGAGHCSMETNPIQFNKALLSFLEI